VSKPALSEKNGYFVLDAPKVSDPKLFLEIKALNVYKQPKV